MHTRNALLAASLLVAVSTAGPALALSEYGIEGMHVVSTAASEVRASVSPDGTRIVWGRVGPDGGSGLWQARLVDRRWQDARPLEINTGGNDFDPVFSADGRWLYFASDRVGGSGGSDLWRAPLDAEGRPGTPENLGTGVNSAGDERAPTPAREGRHLLFASDGRGGAGGHDLFVAGLEDGEFVQPRPLDGINTGADEFDGAWLGDGRTIVFARSDAAPATAPVRLHLAHCNGNAYADAGPLKLSFNTAEATTRAPAPDWSTPGELLVTGIAKAPRAGGLDIYRMKAPPADGQDGCVR